MRDTIGGVGVIPVMQAVALLHLHSAAQYDKRGRKTPLLPISLEQRSIEYYFKYESHTPVTYSKKPATFFHRIPASTPYATLYVQCCNMS
jgi:hypothetical protein